MRINGKSERAADQPKNDFRFFYCHNLIWSSQRTSGFEGEPGDWQAPAYCPEGSFVNGYRVKSAGGRDISGLDLQCHNPKTDEKNTITVDDGSEGVWGEWTYTQENKYMISYEVGVRGRCDSCDSNGISFTVMEPPKIVSAQFEYELHEGLTKTAEVLDTISMTNPTNVEIT